MSASRFGICVSKLFMNVHIKVVYERHVCALRNGHLAHRCLVFMVDPFLQPNAKLKPPQARPYIIFVFKYPSKRYFKFMHTVHCIP